MDKLTDYLKNEYLKIAFFAIFVLFFASIVGAKTVTGTVTAYEGTVDSDGTNLQKGGQISSF